MGFLGSLSVADAGQPTAPHTSEAVMGFPAVEMARPQAPKKQGGGEGWRNVLGILGDALLIHSGRAPMYAPMKAQRDKERQQQLQNSAMANYLGHLGSDPRMVDLISTFGVDPETVLSIEDKRLGVGGRHLKNDRDLNGYAMQVLGSTHDQESYDAARQHLERYLPRFGANVADFNLPDVFDPQAIRDLRLRGMDTPHQMSALDREQRTAWNIEDDQADNARADENAKSMQDYRRAQIANTRRGQDLTDRRVRRGQDLTNGRVRRGQDLTDSRVKGSAGYRGKNSRPSVGDGAIIRNPKTGQRMVLQGGKWVPIK